jgi:hypothetical protein
MWAIISTALWLMRRSRKKGLSPARFPIAQIDCYAIYNFGLDRDYKNNGIPPKLTT